VKVVRDTHRPSSVHERRKQHLASWIRIGTDDRPDRPKEGSDHCSGGLHEDDRILSRTCQAGRGQRL